MQDTNSFAATQVVGGGTFPAGTYDVSYVLRIRSGGQAANNSKIGNSATKTVILNANDRILIAIQPSNKGIGVGQGAGLVDDPFMGGFVSGEVEVYVKKSTDPSFTLQAGGAVTFVWNTATRKWEYTLAAYTTNGAVRSGTQLGQGPIRLLKWWGEFNRCYAVIMDSMFCWNAKRFLAAVPMTVNRDASNNKHYISRLATPMSMAFVSHVPIFTDGFLPKKISDNSVYNSDGSGDIRLLGANPPNANPTVATIAGPGITGAYFYKISFVYRNNRPTGFPTSVALSGRATWDSESNPSAATGVINPANQKVRITFNAAQSESGLQFIRVYRTKASGTTFYKVTDVAAGATTYDDSTTDANLDTTKTPADDTGKVPCDVPPQQLLYLTEFGGYGWGAVGTQVVTTEDAVADRVMGFVGTNVLRISKYMLISGQSDEATIDHWPNTVDYTVVCGSTSRITNLISHRGALYVFKEDEIGIIVGDAPGNFSYRTITSGFGAIPYSAVVAFGVMYFWHYSLAAFIFDGSSAQQVGGDFQYEWLVDQQADYWCYHAYYDQTTNEVHWCFSTMPMDPFSSQVAAGQANAATVRGTWKEYVLFVPTGAITESQGTSYARNIMAATMADAVQGSTQNMYTLEKTLLTGSTEGRVCIEHSSTTDAGTAISAYAEFALFFGQPEDVKLWRFLQITYRIVGVVTVGAISIKVQFAEDDDFGAVIATLPTAIHGQHTEIVTIPQQPGGSPICNDRAIGVRIESTIDADLRILAIMPKWRDDSSVRKAVR